MTFLSKYNFWHGKEPTSKINVECFLPNGICVSLPLIKADTVLARIKAVLWQEAERYALFHLLKSPDHYVFEVVSKGGTEELIDENVSLFDIKPVRPYLKIVPRLGDDLEKVLNSKISMLVGGTKGTAKNEEVNDFRNRYSEFCKNISSQRRSTTWERRAIYTYPPEYDEEDQPSETLKKRLVFTNWHLKVSVSVATKTSFTFNVPYKTYPKELLKMALTKKDNTSSRASVETYNDYVLRVFGCLNFFLGYVVQVDGQEIYGEKSLFQYKYIQQCLLWNKPIKLQLVRKTDMAVEPFAIGRTPVRPPVIPPKKQRSISLWNLSPSTKLKIKIICALNVNSPAMMKEVVCGIYHGTEEMCEQRKTSIQSGVNPQWKEFLEFDIPVSELPRMAKLCFSIVGRKRGQAKKTIIAWVNVTAMDFKSCLQSGMARLYCWFNYGKLDSEIGLLNPLGTVASSENEGGPCIVINCMKFSNQVAYPMEEEIIELAQCAAARASVQNPTASRQQLSHIEEIIKKDILASLFDEEKELLWQFRNVCRSDYPESLPKLLQSVKWNRKEEVAQLYVLLQNWKIQALQVETALDLLDYSFPDDKVRELAVRVLENLSDGELEMYLLQLVQALKYESYLHSPLGRFLLGRALNNKRIGHYLFWHLKAELRNHDCSLLFGILLEFYCIGAVSHIDTLLRQMEAINKLKTITEILQANKDDAKQRDNQLRNLFNQPAYVKAFSGVISPLDPSMHLKKLKVEKCKHMDSAKKPLWLVFENMDEGAEDIYIIFKNGDDLRQDMLTLLSLRLMENVWRKSNLDYGLIPYKCLSTGYQIGMIEVVTQSETLARIQARHGRFGVLSNSSLYTWISNKCNNEETLADCVSNFTRSLIGYSIATYALGIGDRHNDNVMMKYDTGQLFHIDFGHFLGNFKTKFGVRRERVKFLLPDEFIYIIERTNKNISRRENFDNFRKMCIEAFKTLRSHGNLIITVFAMLLSTGIPELKQPEDLDYIRDSLALQKDEADAIEHFSAAFKEAYDRRGSTSVMWMIHSMRHHWI